jgi:hypothetical protein
MFTRHFERVIALSFPRPFPAPRAPPAADFFPPAYIGRSIHESPGRHSIYTFSANGRLIAYLDIRVLWA